MNRAEIATAGTRPSSPRLSLRQALILVFVGALAYVAVVGLILVIRVGPATQRLPRESTTVMNEYNQSEYRIRSVDKVQGELQALVGAMPTEQVDSGLLRSIRARLQEAEEDSRTLARMAAPSGSRTELRSLLAYGLLRESAWRNVLLAAAAAVELHDAAAARELLNVADLRSRPVHALFNVETSAVLRAVRREESNIAEVTASSTRLVGLWFVGGLLLLPVVAVFVRRRVAAPLAVLDDGLARVSAGDLSVELEPAVPDELGRLALHFNRMTAVLRERAAQEEERTATESTARTRAILEAALDAVVVIDEQGVVHEWSPRAVATFGWSRDEAMGRLLADLIIPEESRADHTLGLRAYGQRATTPMLGRRVETVAQRRDGTRLPVELAISPLHRQGRTEFSAFIRDLTEQHRMESELRQAQKMDAVGQLAAGIAHDFNNLLTGIMGYADLMRHDEQANAQLREDAAAVLAAAERGADLARGMLTLARRSHARDESVDLTKLAQEVMDVFSRTVDRRIEVTLALSADAAVARGDRSQLANALLNLVINAADAMPNGGQLTIGMRVARLDEQFTKRHSREAVPGEFVVLTVRDTGHGMSSDVRARIFEPFFTTKPIGEGTGLGLSMVYGTVRSHRGIVTVDSAEGTGTTFTIYLPLDHTGAELEIAPVREVRTGRGRILLADDEAQVRDVMARLMRRMGYAVELACDGEEAVELVRADPDRCDLVVLDGNMPRMTGPDAARAIRAIRPGLPLVLSTGYFDADSDETPAAKLFDGTIAKPFDLAALSQILATYVPS